MKTRRAPRTVRNTARRRTVRTNDEIFAATRAQLVTSARGLFAERGYGGTSTEDLVTSAGTTRGALYYHFQDKRDIFRAVFEEVAGEISANIHARAGSAASPIDRLLEGCEGFIVKCLEPDVARIYLVDGPAVLGWSEWRALDAALNVSALEEAVTEVVGARAERNIVQLRSTAISGLLNEVALLAAFKPGAVKRSQLLDETRAMVAGMLRALRSRT